VGMVDPWELLDRASNVENLTEKLIITSVLIYTNRDRLEQIATKTAVKFKVMKPPDVVVQMKPATARVHATSLSAQSKGIASLTATPRVSRPSPAALQELLSWYLRIASS
jgi:hypothetical protein